MDTQKDNKNRTWKKIVSNITEHTVSFISGAFISFIFSMVVGSILFSATFSSKFNVVQAEAQGVPQLQTDNLSTKNDIISINQHLMNIENNMSNTNTTINLILNLLKSK